MKVATSVMIASPNQLNLLLTKDLPTWKQKTKKTGKVRFCHLCLWMWAVEVHGVCTNQACAVAMKKLFKAAAPV